MYSTEAVHFRDPYFNDNNILQFDGLRGSAESLPRKKISKRTEEKPTMNSNKQSPKGNPMMLKTLDLKQ